ncbi:MAG: response regulator [Spirochaetota bacterium]|nr:MAG: response regulator [Spirochaetota bacterium]
MIFTEVGMVKQYKAARILVVDDDESIRKIIQIALRENGLVCFTASSGDEAITILSEETIDVVIADIHMPGMDGIELTKIVKDRYKSDVIVLTGFVQEFTYERVVEEGASDFIQKPVTIEELLVRIKRVLKERKLLSERNKAESELQNSYEQLQKAIKGIIHAMAVTVEIRDPYTAGHQKRVAALACAIAEELGLNADTIDGIRMAGAIHDHGKISVPAEILSKPGQLTRFEFGIIKTHPQVGYDILRNIEFPWPVDQMILQHHERLNGSGYPAGLSGKKILIEARIIAVADVLEAMANHRPYRPALGIEKALEEIKKNRDSIYDPDVVNACLKLLADGKFDFE